MDKGRWWQAVPRCRWRWALLACCFGLLSLMLGGCRGTRNLRLEARVGRETAGRSLAVYKDYVLAAARYNGLCIVNVQDPEHPVKESCLDVGVPVAEVATSGDFAFVATDDGLLIVDLTDVRAPRVIGRYQTGTTANDVAAKGEYVFLVGVKQLPGVTKGVTILDVSNPENPVPVQTFHFRKLGNDVTVSEIALSPQWAYVIVSVGGVPKVQVLDISDLNHPRLVDVGSFVQSYVEHLRVVGKRGYIGGWNDVEAFDLSDPFHPVSIGRVELENIGIFNGMAVSEPYVYLADIFGLRVVDVSDPTRPREIGHYKLAQGGDVVELPSQDAEPGRTRYVAVIDKTEGVLIFSFRP